MIKCDASVDEVINSCVVLYCVNCDEIFYSAGGHRPRTVLRAQRDLPPGVLDCTRLGSRGGQQQRAGSIALCDAALFRAGENIV